MFSSFEPRTNGLRLQSTVKHATCMVGVFRTLLIAAAVGLCEAVVDVWRGIAEQLYYVEVTTRILKRGDRKKGSLHIIVR